MELASVPVRIGFDGSAQRCKEEGAGGEAKEETQACTAIVALHSSPDGEAGLVTPVARPLVANE